MEAANVFVPIALVAFVPVAFACLARLGPRRGVPASLLGGWLFLPSFDGYFDVPLVHTKAAFVPAVVLLASFLLDGHRWRAFRLGLLDVPITLLCVVPMASSLTNDLGAYDGCAAAFHMTLCWGAPYFLGRLYLGEPRGMTEFATALVTSAVAYVPLCLWEIRMSPQLHRTLYGFHTFGFFSQSIRYGGFRPVVFTLDGLMLGMFMTTSTLVAFWLWRAGVCRTILRVPMSWACTLLGITAVLGKSIGALVLLVAGIIALECTRRLRSSVLVVTLLATPFVYCGARLSGWTGENVVELASKTFGEDRAESIRFRLYNEDMLSARALQQPWVGWGGWGRARVYDEEGDDRTITDGMWIITLGNTGFIGLAALLLTLALPVAALLFRFRARHWPDPRLAAAAALAVSLSLWAIDDISNAMLVPLYPASAGALVSFVLLARRAPGPARQRVDPVRKGARIVPVAPGA
jgi:hypothetical protein